MRFLLLDDDPDDRLLAERSVLAEFPDAAVDALGDRAGLDAAIARGGYDAVVTDYRLRWTDGLTVLTEIRRLWPWCPVILFTSSGNEEVAVEAMKSGAADYVLKSDASRGRLGRAVRRAVEQAADRRRVDELGSQLQRLTDALGVGVFRATLDGTLVSCNAAFLRIVGRPSLEEARSTEISALLRANAESDRLGREHPLLRPDGAEVRVAVRGLMRRTDGEGFVDGLLEDVTARRALEEALRQRTQQLEEADRRKDEFLAMLAHELRNPLAPLRSTATAIGRLATDPQLVRASEIIERQVRVLTRMIDDLLDVARVSRGKIRIVPQPVVLADLVSQALEMVRPQLAGRARPIDVQLPDEPVVFVADRTRFVQALANLLDNAAKFTPADARIALAAERADDAIVVTVEDEGIGIGPDLLPVLFDLFTQGDMGLDRQRGGLGIGLTLVRRLVELHGGSVTAESAGPGRGSRFVVRLPAVPPELTAAAPPTAAPAAPARRVLVVDDNRDAADSLRDLLQTLGHAVHTAYDGPAALTAAARFAPEVVFLDLGLPGMDGYEVGRALRSTEHGRALRLVALSGYGRTEDRARTAEVGFDLHLTKPADLDAILGALA